MYQIQIYLFEKLFYIFIIKILGENIVSCKFSTLVWVYRHWSCPSDVVICTRQSR